MSYIGAVICNVDLKRMEKKFVGLGFKKKKKKQIQSGSEKSARIFNICTLSASTALCVYICVKNGKRITPVSEGQQVKLSQENGVPFCVKKKIHFLNCLRASILLPVCAGGDLTVLSSPLCWSTEEVEGESCSSLTIYHP